MSGACWLFYHIQNDRGESGAHPNACRLKPSTSDGGAPRVTLQDVLDVFPLAGTGSFHFRFQVVQDKQVMFLDLTHPADVVPLVGQNVIAKVLRLDTVRCASRNNAGLQLRNYTGSSSVAGRASRGTGAAAASNASSSSSNAAAFAAATAALAMPVMRSGGAHHDVAKEVDGETHIKDTGDGEDIYKKLKAVDERGMRPVKAVSEDVGKAVPPPAVVDADLADKSAYVQAKVMAARQEAEKAAAERLAEVAARENAANQVSAERDAARLQHEARLREWGTEPGGKSTKPIRALLATLHTVLWEGAKWEPAPMAKLVVPSKVKFFFLKACTVVHPDKVSGETGAHQYVAAVVFDYLNTAFREFQEKEMGQ